MLHGFSDAFANVPQQVNFNSYNWNGSAYVFDVTQAHLKTRPQARQLHITHDYGLIRELRPNAGGACTHPFQGALRRV